MSGAPDPKPQKKNRRFGPKPERRRFDYDDARARYIAGETTTALAAEYGVSDVAVGAALKRMGVAIRADAWRDNLQIANERQKAGNTCKSGHEFTESNTNWKKTLGGYVVRECTTCRNLNVQKRRASQKARGLGRLKGWHIVKKGVLPICRNCGSTDRVQLHHAIPRSKCAATRADLRNGIPLCHECHWGWHSNCVTIYRDLFEPDEWAYISSAELTGENIKTWLDKRYPKRPIETAA